MEYSGHAKYQKREQRIQKEPSRLEAGNGWLPEIQETCRKLRLSLERKMGKSNMWKIKVPGEGWKNNLSRAGELRNSLTSTPSAKIWPQSLADE